VAVILTLEREVGCEEQAEFFAQPSQVDGK
jgi:hypothetical protein